MKNANFIIFEFMSWAFYFKCLIRGQNKDREGQAIGLVEDHTLMKSSRE